MNTILKDEDCHCGHDHHHNHGECQCQHEHHDVKPERDKGGIKFQIQGLDCANCALKVENEIKKQKYIDDAVINFSTGTLIVKANDKNDLLVHLQDVINHVEKGVTLFENDKQKFKNLNCLFLKIILN